MAVVEKFSATVFVYLNMKYTKKNDKKISVGKICLHRDIIS